MGVTDCTESINPHQMFQHLESCQPTPIPGPGTEADVAAETIETVKSIITQSGNPLKNQKMLHIG